MRGTPKSSILYEEFPLCKLAIYGILTAPHLRANALTLPCWSGRHRPSQTLKTWATKGDQRGKDMGISHVYNVM